jgi:hypothetical protein
MARRRVATSSHAGSGPTLCSKHVLTEGLLPPVHLEVYYRDLPRYKFLPRLHVDDHWSFGSIGSTFRVWGLTCHMEELMNKPDYITMPNFFLFPLKAMGD